jgi:hypothetical protein
MRFNPIRWLYGELPRLVERGVLTPGAAESLRDHYGPLPERSSRRILLLVFGVLGALLVGSGVVLLLAHNWEFLSRPVRAGLSLGPLLCAQAIALWVVRRRFDSAAWTEGSATFLSLSIVACISLIGQTYNLGGDVDSVLFAWVALTVPVVYLLRSRVTAVLALTGATWWLMLAPWPRPSISVYWTYLAFVAILAPFLVWLHRSQRHEPRSAMVEWAACASLALAVVRLIAWPETGLWAPLYAGLLGSFYVFGRGRTHSSAENVAAWRRPFHVFGALGLGVLLLVGSFGDTWDTDWGWDAATDGYASLVIPIAITLSLSLVSTIAGARLLGKSQWGAGLLAYTPVMAVLGWIASFEPGLSMLVVLSMNLFALAVGLTICIQSVGSGRLGTANGGLLLVLAVLTARFFDADLSFVARGVGFILLGSSLLGMNLWMIRQQKEVPS